MVAVFLPQTRLSAFLPVGYFAFSLLSSPGNNRSAFFSLWFFYPQGTFEDSLYPVTGVWSLSVMGLVGNLLLPSVLI